MIEIIPTKDLGKHQGRYCSCEPNIDSELIVHRSFDGRELRKKEEWMLIEPETLTIEEWADYQNKKCLCNALAKNECACGAWTKEK
ncbi:hypothetical protein H8D04_00075 [bacterium]|nr:hypothetical protein [bacterium]